MKTLTLKRASPLDVILVPVMVADVTLTTGQEINAEFDTGNDHTCLRRDVLDQLRIQVVGRPMPVNGVTGSAMVTVMKLFLGFKMDDGHRCEINGHEVVILDQMTCSCLLGRDMLRIFNVDLLTDGTAILKYG